MASSLIFGRRKRSSEKNVDRDALPATRNSHPRNLLRHKKARTILVIVVALFLALYIRSSTQSSSKLLFIPSPDPLPVHHDSLQLFFHNHPVSVHRPRNQFVGARDHSLAPIITIFTVTNNPKPHRILETYESLHQQSLQSFRWLIVNDHTTNESSLAVLAQLIAMDSRIVVVDNDGPKGVTAARNKALSTALAFGDTEFISALDDDDLLELTTLEKVVWMLTSNPEWDLASFFWVKFGAQNVTEINGVHLGPANYYSENYVANAAVFRRKAVGNCKYDDEFSKGGEDWDFWLCLAENGHWGGTLPEFAYWYRVNPKAFREARWGDSFNDGIGDLKLRIQNKHRSLDRPFGIPSLAAHRSVALETITWEPPFHNPINHASKSIMFVIPWLHVGGADIGALHMIQIFAEAGYRVTVVCTLYKNPAGIEIRPLVLQYTHDLHILPSFLRAHDFPRYIKYLLQSRAIEHVVLSNSQLMYELLPALTEQLPDVKFIDYLHNEAYDGWKSGGYPTYSVITQRFLARTITCSFYLRDWIIAKGHSPDRTGVIKLGIEISDFSPTNDTYKTQQKKELLTVGPEVTVISIVARLDPQKRPTMVPDIVDSLLRMGGKNFLIVMLGDGDSATEVKERIKHFKVGDYIRMLGTVSRPQDYLAATDIFLLPSMSEGISIAVAEAMAMGLPVVTARAGALPEQLSDGVVSAAGVSLTAGILVNHTLDNEADAPLYAAVLYQMLSDPALRTRLGVQARANVENTFDWHVTLQGMFEEVELSQNYHRHTDKGDAALPNPAAHFAIQNLLLEANSETDFAAYQSTLKAPARTGVGLELQQRCGESSAEVTTWLDSITKPRLCEPGKIELDSDALILSAKYQCGAWCIFDLAERELAGWSYNGDCFTILDDTSWCKEFWGGRPAIQLPPKAGKAPPPPEEE